MTAKAQGHSNAGEVASKGSSLDNASCATLMEVFLNSRLFRDGKLRGSIKRDVDEVAAFTWRELEERPISKYFPDRLPHESGASQAPHTLSEIMAKNALPKEDLDNFYRDLKETTEYAVRFDAQGDRKEFLQWIEQKRETIFSRANIEQLINEGYTMGRLRYELHMAFVISKAAKDKGFLFRYLVRPFKDQRVRRWIAPVVAAVGATTAAVWTILKGSLTAGPAASLVSALVEPEVAPVRNNVNQFGNQVYDVGSEHVAKIKEFFVGKEDLNDADEARKHLGGLIAELDALKLGDPIKLAVWWNQKEDDFFKDLVTLQKALPAHLRDGRNLLMDSQYKTPLNFAAQASTFKNEFNTAKLLYKNTEERLAALNANDPKRKELLKELEQYGHEMESAHQRLASALAVWKVNEVMYRELFMPQKGEEGTSTRTKDYAEMVKLLRFDEYINEVEKELMNVIRVLDIQLGLQTELGKEFDKLPPEVKAQVANKGPASVAPATPVTPAAKKK